MKAVPDPVLTVSNAVNEAVREGREFTRVQWHFFQNAFNPKDRGWLIGVGWSRGVSWF
jgi:hypothetical protein